MSDEKLKSLVAGNIERYYSGETLTKAKAQADHELEVIKKLGCASYFLFVYDFVSWATVVQNIPKGPGRGAAPASIINYILGITDIDPLKYNLVFERFIHSERISQSDIFIDFCLNRYKEVKQYCLDVQDPSLIKQDILGLRILTIVDQCEKYINQNYNNNFRISNISLEDKKTYLLLQKGQTIGCFQLAAPGLRETIKRLKPDNFSDIIAMLSLYRPGPLEIGLVDQYIARKHGKEKYKLLFPELTPYLEETYGLILYQEQLMQIANTISGFTMIQADNFRKVLGKRNVKQVAELKIIFLQGAKQNGFDKQKAEKLFDQCSKYTPHSFIKAHAVSYAVLTYKTAYLKANYPTEYMAAVLDVTRMLTPELENELSRMGINLNGYASELLKDWASIDSCLKIIPQGNTITVDYEL